jgi:DedD protein
VSEGLAQRVAGTLVLGVIGLIVLPLLIDFTDPNKVDRTTKIPPAPSIDAVSLESAQRPPDVIDGGASAAILDVNKSVPVDDYDGPDFGLTDRGLPHTWILQVGSFVEEPKAEILLKQLVDRGFKAFIAPAVVAGEHHYRVLVGPKIDRRRIKVDRDNIDLMFKTKSIVLKYET